MTGSAGAGRGDVSRRVVLAGLASVGLAAAPAASQTRPPARGVRPGDSAQPNPSPRVSPSQAPVLMLGTDMHVGPVRAVAVSGDGMLIATGSSDRSVRLWKASTNEEIRRLYLPLGQGSIGVVDSLAFSADGKRLFVAGIDWATSADSLDSAVYVFDLATNRLTGLMAWAPGFGSRLATLAVSSAGGQIALAAGRRGLIVRDTERAGFPQIYADGPGAAAPTTAVAYSSDGMLLATASGDGVVRLLQIGADGRAGIVSQRSLRPGRPDTVAFSPDGERLAVSFSDRALVQVMPVRSGGPLVSLATPAGASAGNLAAINWCRGGDGQAWLCAAGTVVDPAGRNLMFAWRDGQAGNPVAIAVSADSVAQSVAHPTGGSVFGSSDARWGRVMPAANGRSLSLDHEAQTERLDFRGVVGRLWGIDPTGRTVVFKGAGGSQTGLEFDLNELTLRSASGAQAELNHPRPVPDRTPAPPGLGLPPGTMSRAADRMRGNGGMLYGTDDYLVLADPAGRPLGRAEIATAAWGVAIAGGGKLAIAAHGDGTIRWYSLDPNQLLAELGGLFVTADGQSWIAWRSDGRFAHSSAGGARLIGFLQNGQFVPGHFAEGGMTGEWIGVDQLYGQFYDPDRVRQMLDQAKATTLPTRNDLRALNLPKIDVGGLCPARDAPTPTRGVKSRETADPGAANAAPTPPPAETSACRPIDESTLGADETILLPAGTRSVRATLSLSPTDADTQVAAFVNGQNVGQVVARRGDGRGIGPIAVDQLVPLFPGDNRIEFRAYGADNRNFNRAPVILRVRAEEGAQAQDEPKPMLRMLSVGINTYRGAIPALGLARQDAETIAGAIQQRAAFPVALLPPLYDAAATLDAVTDGMAKLAQDTRPADAVIIYLSGHGVVGTQNNAYSFLTADVTDLNAALDGRAGFTGAMLAQSLSKLRAARIFVFLDTCHAGGFDPRSIGYLNQETGRYVLAASTRFEEAQDTYDGKNGLFAYAVKEALDGNAMRSGGSIDAFDVGRYVRDRVEALAKEKSWEQRAVFQAAGQVTAFPLVSAG